MCVCVCGTKLVQFKGKSSPQRWFPQHIGRTTWARKQHPQPMTSKFKRPAKSHFHQQPQVYRRMIVAVSDWEDYTLGR